MVGTRGALSQYIEKYNTHRLHFNLKGMTPMEYIKCHVLETHILSHIL
ncbi:MAG: IS3 family transposase [Holosporales bacterium]|nr:IS3 family transposase [Holosporales bacterium]